MDQAKLDEYLRAGQWLFEKRGDRPSVIDEDEMKYKGQIIERLARARVAVLADRDDWASLLVEAMKRPPNNITEGPRRQFSPVLKAWLGSEEDRAILLRALKALWTEEGKSAGDRVRAFADLVHPQKGFETRAQRLTPIAYLLMALGHDYPPFRSRNLRLTYERLGYPPHPPKDKIVETYEHELEFLDQIVQHSDGRPVDLLEAQSLVWQMQWVKEPLVDPNNSDPLTKRLDNLGKKLLLEPASFLSKTVWPMLKDKRQIIFQGPPGTGKTFVARALAECLAGSEDRVRVVQFHPSYAYEDFVQGFRPTLEDGKAGFVLRDGPLVEMAEQAWLEQTERHFLVIDEINRGNLAKVFGELYYLLEYRNEPMPLQYAEKDADPFSLPDNLYIIGTMNTADRSIALVDAALRRRFYFLPFQPDEEPIKGLLEAWIDKYASEMDWVADVVELANKKLSNKEAAIGPSYFMKKEGLDEEKLKRVWKYNVLPYIEEQLYGGTLKIEDFALQTLRDEVKRAPNARPPEGDGEQGGSGESALDGNEGN